MRRPLENIRPFGPIFKQQTKVDTESVKRRLRRMDMQDIGETTMIGSDEVIVEFRIPGKSPAAPSGLAGMRQLRSLYKFNTDGELRKVEYRMPTIVFGSRSEIGMNRSIEIEQEAKATIEQLMDESGFYNSFVIMRGGGTITDVGYTPHIMHPESRSAGGIATVDEALDWLSELYPKYMREFDEEAI